MALFSIRLCVYIQLEFFFSWPIMTFDCSLSEQLISLSGSGGTAVRLHAGRHLSQPKSCRDKCVAAPRRISLRYTTSFSTERCVRACMCVYMGFECMHVCVHVKKRLSD